MIELIRMILKSQLLWKNTLTYFQVCYRSWSGFVTFRKHHTTSQSREILAQWQGVTSHKIWTLKNSCDNLEPRTNFKVANVSLLIVIIRASGQSHFPAALPWLKTAATHYFESLGRPRRRSGSVKVKICTPSCVNICRHAKCTTNK